MKGKNNNGNSDCVHVSLILVRYCEIGLKSTPVRRRFEAILKENMLSMLASDGIEALITYADARYFIETDDIDGCVNSVNRPVELPVFHLRPLHLSFAFCGHGSLRDFLRNRR